MDIFQRLQNLVVGCKPVKVIIALNFLHFFAEVAECRTAGNFSTQGFYFGRLGSIDNLLDAKFLKILSYGIRTMRKK